jgi:hypothetical protein
LEIATLLVSEKFQPEEKITPFKEVLPLAKEYFSTFCNENNLYYNGDKELKFNNTIITFYLSYSPKIHRYFLCFLPKNVWEYALKKELLVAFNDTIACFKKLPSSIQLGKMSFSKPSISNHIDISDWSFTTNPDVGKNKISQIQFAEIRRIGNIIYSKKNGSIDKRLLIIDNGGLLHVSKRNKIREKFAPLFIDSEIIQCDECILERIDKRTDVGNLFVIFFGSKKSIDESYRRYKQYFISKGIPSQFISLEKVDNILQWGFENLLFEILKKAQEEDSISLDPVLPSNVDALLCLSDINTLQNNKVFGISIALTGIGATSEWLEVYNDVNYETKYEEITFQREELTKLGNKIEALSNLQGKIIDVFVTKRWQAKDVGHLSKVLEKYNITIRKFLYVGSKANRFLFSSLSDESMPYTHPYILWDKRAASIQTNSKIQLYGTMFPIYIELLNPWSNEELTEEDLKMILWLVKKRIYRIANFYNLKVPELLSMFEEAKKLNLIDISGKMRINLHTII